MQDPEAAWFTALFGIEEPQYELPFVDFRVDRDVPLYIDPFAIAKDPSELAQGCTAAIQDYFQTLLDAILSGDPQRVRRLLSTRLSEPGQIHLGVSSRARKGRGLGSEQEAQIAAALASSTAARTGLIETIQELELHVPLIGPDKISDLVANIILGYLARFTEDVCELYGIPTRPCPVDGFWDTGTKAWAGGFFNLPVRQTHSYVLVPKRFVRRERDLINHSYFYQKYILETLQRELLTADDSLVETLRTGQQGVTKAALKADPRFGLSKRFVSEFIVSHPDTVAAYREELAGRYRPADAAEWSGKMAEDDPAVAAALASLPALEPGRKDERRYQQVVLQLLAFVFDQSLENFDTEYRMDGGRGRIDIIADNRANGGFFLDARSDLDAVTVPMECKNYGGDLGNDEFNQLAGRMGPKTSRLGFLVCRSADKAAAGRHAGDRWLRQDLLIVVIDDEKLVELVQLRLARNFEGIQSRLRHWTRGVQYGCYR